MKRKLHSFLKKHGAVHKFWDAMENQSCAPSYTIEEAYACGEVDADVLQSSFFWDKSVEGHKYWQELDDKYQSEF